MNLSAINLFKSNYPAKHQGCFRYSNLKPLACDTVSFGAMKKNGFDGIDLLVVNKFKAPVEKFNNNEDLQKWCKDKIEELKERDLEGRSEETTIQRKATFKEWVDYIENENDAYKNSAELLILDGVLKDIDKSNDTEIPPLNKRLLADTIDKLSNIKGDVNFNKEYKLALQNMALDNLETHIDINKTGWVIIPSKENDPEHFEENVDKLKSLSYKTWCTASFNAEPYLEKGDFHVYLEKGCPKLGVRFDKDEIQEIQGEKNNSKIPIKYLNVALEHTTDKKLSQSVQTEFKQAEITEQKIKKVENELKKQGVDFNTCSAHQLFEALNIEHEVDHNGMIILEGYGQTSCDYTFEDLGVNENRLFKEIKEIKGDADFEDSNVTHLGNLERIGGFANFYYSKVTNLGNLKTIGENARFNHSLIKSLDKLESIGGYANFSHSKIEDLGQLKNIGGYACFSDSKITDLKNLETIGLSALFENSEVMDLGKLKCIGGNAQMQGSKFTSLKNLETVKGTINFKNSQITDLGALKNIVGDALIFGSKLKVSDFENIQVGNLEELKRAFKKLKSQGVDFETCSAHQLFDALDIEHKVDENGMVTIDNYEQPKDYTFEDIGVDENRLFKGIKRINGSVDFEKSKVTNLGNLESIGGDARFQDSKVTDLGALKRIEGKANFSDSKIISLGNLESIEGKAYFNDSQVKDLGRLKSIGGYACFSDSQITDLKNLETIGGSAYFEDSEVKDLGKLKYIGKNAIIKNSKLRLEDFVNIRTINLEEPTKALKKLIAQGVDFKTCSARQLFDVLNVRYELDKDGMIILDNYKWPYEYFSFSDLGVDENKLFKEIKEIKESINFKNFKVTNLGNLESIGGNANFEGSEVVNLGNLKQIKGDANFSKSKIKSLNNLEQIKGDANFNFSEIKDLGKLKCICGNAIFGEEITLSPYMLMSMMGSDISFYSSEIESLGDLQSIGGDAFFSNSKIKNLGALKRIDGNAIIKHSKLSKEDFKDILVSGKIEQ